jgi:hypothetical protein
MRTIEQLREAKKFNTYHQLSKALDLPINTLRRWLKDEKIGNKVYEQVVAERLRTLKSE